MDPAVAAVLASWTLDWGTLFVLVATVALYLRGWLRLRIELPRKYTAGRLAAFAGGLVAVLLALESPVDVFGGLLLQAHMIQHLLLIMVAPALLLLGQPVLPLLRGLPRWIFKDALGPFLSCRELRRLGRAMVHPLVSWFALASVIVVWHLPRLYELGLHSQAWHQTEHACFFWSAVVFWWPVIGVWPSYPVWPRWAMIPYLALADLVNTGLSAVLCFSDHVLYPSYQLTPRLWGISALDDQAAAGAIMWVPGSIAFLVPAVVIGMRALEPRRVRADNDSAHRSPSHSSKYAMGSNADAHSRIGSPISLLSAVRSRSDVSTRRRGDSRRPFRTTSGADEPRWRFAVDLLEGAGSDCAADGRQSFLHGVSIYAASRHSCEGSFLHDIVWPGTIALRSGLRPACSPRTCGGTRPLRCGTVPD